MKTHAFLLATFLSLSASEVQAQHSSAWTVRYNAPGESLQDPFRLEGTPDGGVISVQISRDVTGDQRTLVAVKFSENGERVWEFSKPLVGRPTIWNTGIADGRADATGALYMSYASQTGSGLLKLDPSGALLWDVPITGPGPLFTASHLVLDSAGLPIVGGQVNVSTFPFFAVAKYASDGTLIWTDGGTQQGCVTRMAIGPGDEIVLFGRDDWNFAGSLYFGRLARFNADGTPDWIQVLSTDGYGTLCCGTIWSEHIEDGLIDAQGHVHAFVNGSFGAEWFHDGWVGFAIARYDPAGVLAYRTVIDTPRSTEGVQMAVDSAQNVYVVGMETETDFGSNSGLTLWRIDANGDLDWMRRLPSSTTTRSHGVAVNVTPNGGALVLGTRANGAGGTIQIEFDAAGNEVWRNEIPGASTSPLSSVFTRSDVLANVNDQVFTQATEGRRMRITKYAPGIKIGALYCGPAPLNSSGASGEIDAIGSEVASSNNVTLRLSMLPGNAFALLLNSRTQGSVPNLAGGDGTLCLGGAIGRFTGPNELRRTLADGTSSFRVDMGAVPTPTGFGQVVSGQTWNFQGWYRDANPGATSNLTNGVSISFL